MKRPALLACATALAFALAGCAADATRTYGSAYPSYDPSLPRQARTSGPVPVTLNGNPFSPADIVDALNAMPNVHGVTFAPAAGPVRSGYWIALDFTRNTSNPCNAEAANSMPFDAGTTTLQVVAGFCRSGGLLSRTTGMAPRPARADDPGFRRFTNALVVELMPAFKPWGVENGSCVDRPNC